MYDRKFWLAFTANFLLVTANALTFRFAEFVRFLGGTEEMTGRIISIGLVGSLIWRFFLGQAIDRFGVRRVWLCSSLIYVIGCWLIITSADIGWHIYAARVTFAIGLASMLSCALSHVQTLAPDDRRTELIGMYGASGFLGMVCGAQLGDLIFLTWPESQFLFNVLFGLTMALGIGHSLLAVMITSDQRHERPDVTPAVHRLLFRYWPPLVMIVTVMMGLVFAVTTVFLTRYATSLGLSGIRTFFTAYAMTAFVMRIVGRRWSKVAGRHKLIVLGLAAHAAGQFALIFVTRDWHLIPAAICGGFAHALLFPCAISLGAGAFPQQYRGTGTTVTLASIDFGIILTAPTLGWTIDHFGFTPMFIACASTLAASSLVYGVLTRHQLDDDMETAGHLASQAARRPAVRAAVAPAAGLSTLVSQPEQPAASERR